MRHYRLNGRFYMWVTLAIVIVFLILILNTTASIRANDRALAELDSEKAELIDQINELSGTLEYVQSDAYVERVARDELNMIMPGEVRYTTTSN